MATPGLDPALRRKVRGWISLRKINQRHPNFKPQQQGLVLIPTTDGITSRLSATALSVARRIFPASLPSMSSPRPALEIEGMADDGKTHLET
jgi:hypothetical protein